MAKKAKAKKAKQLPLVEKTAKVSKPAKSTAKFVSFTVTAVIPTQQYGNIQPKIEVQAASYEEACDFAMPMIEALYAKYMESKPGFMGRIQVTEKVVAPPAAVAPKLATVQTPTTPQAGHVADSSATASAAQQSTANQAAPAKPKSEFVLKAEKMLSLAATEEAAVRIQDQIEKSTKIAPEDKPALLTLCLQRRGELEKAK